VRRGLGGAGLVSVAKVLVILVVVLLRRQEGRSSLLFARLFVYSAEERVEARDKREQTHKLI
jgi:hypothetical protein